MEKVNGGTFARAIAISLVVANHSTDLFLGGGMNFLLLMAGYNLALFSFNKNTDEIIRDFFNMVKKILVPAALIIIFYGLYFNNIVWSEIFFVSYLLGSNERNALIPVWYCQVLLQMFVMLIIFFKISDFSAIIKRNRIKSTLIILLVTLLIQLALWQSYPWGRVPYAYLWNFCLGWCLWAILSTYTQRTKMLATILVTLTSILAFYSSIASLPHIVFRVIIFISLTLLFIWGQNIKLPKPLAFIVNLIGKATLYIFLFHWSFIELYKYYFSIDNPGKLDDLMSMFVGILGSCFMWVLFTSIGNTKNRFNKLYKKP